jgi:sigma-B regulation protein RsbU (phosphoserine phosphatase)
LLLTLAIVFAAAMVLYSVCWIYYSIHPDAPVEIGMDTDSVPAGLRIKSVQPGSPSERAGLRVGDVITAIDGRSIATEGGLNVLWNVWFRSQPGDTVQLTVQRPGQAAPLTITPVFRRTVGNGDASLAQRRASRVLLAYPALFLVIGLAVLFLRYSDRNAWLLAMMFAGFTSIATVPTSFRAAPNGLREFLYTYLTVWDGLLSAVFYFFFAVFPTRSVIDRKLPWLKWVLLIVAASLRWGNLSEGRIEPLPFLSHLFSPRAADWMRITTGYGSVLLGIAALLLNVVSVTDKDERRKLKVMVWGTLVGIIPAVLIGMAYDFRGLPIPFWMVFTQAIFLFVFPLSFAYAVVKHRVMDIPVLLRRSARYFLVERGFAVLIFLLSIAITLWFGQAFARRFTAGPKAAIPIGATLGVLLITGATQVHRQVRTRLDRAFFRSAYDSQQVLENLAATALSVTDRQSLAELLYQHIHEALHPMPLVIYLLSAENQLRSYAGHPPEEEMILSPDDPVLRQVVAARGPLELDPATLRATPLERIHAECLVPIGGSMTNSTARPMLAAGGNPPDSPLHGLMALGPRLSEEPYSTRDKRLLASVASQASIAMRSISLAEHMAERIEAERRAEQEMQIARQVQSRLLPQEAPQLATLDCAGECIQTRAVGGDYYDFLDFGSGKLGLVLADISGKGISGALLMANLQASLRGQYALAAEDLPRLLRSVNHLFYKNTEANHYATMFFSIYDDEVRTLRYVNCGHNPPMLLRAGGCVESLEATATVLGLFQEWECTVAERQLNPGDILLIYTDGISEAAPAEDAEEFGEERLIQGMKVNRHESASQMLNKIIAEVQQFSQGEQADDMTLIVAKCR